MRETRNMRDRTGSTDEQDQQALERENLRGPADYDEGGGTGLEPLPGDAVIGGGVSGGDEDPIREPVRTERQKRTDEP